MRKVTGRMMRDKTGIMMTDKTGTMMEKKTALLLARKSIAFLLAFVLTVICFTGCGKSKALTDDQAVSAIREYCMEANPDLESMVNDENYVIGWSVESSSDDEIVVLYQSYTSAEVRYYINRASGETYVTEYVEGITKEEEKTDESFNVWDYVK
ncbi:MAG: hypothetical protein K6F30_04780 [Lachnospiraceae bacterium]|nr:hypothetical protein [Lachnospiraceae bacterium]